MVSVHGRKKRAVAPADGGGLPTDVLFEVLLRFPANVLCRLRLVCRSWQAVTSDPIFARAHASRHPLVVTGFHFAPRKYEVRVLDLSGNIVKRMPLAQPSHTLNTQLNMICVTGTPGSVLDLAVGEAIAALSLQDDEQDLGDAISPFLLGHVPSTGEHMVFYSHARTVRGEEGVHALQVCYVMTLGSGGGWRVMPSPPARITSSFREMVVVGGVAYFLLDVLYSADCSNVEPDAIAVFDLATEMWRPTTLQGPLSSCLGSDDAKLVYHQYRHHIQFATMDGCLVTLHHNHHQCSSMDLWFLTDMGVGKGLWNKRYSIQSATDLCALRNSYPLLLLDDARIVIWEHPIGALRLYNPRTDKWADLATLKGSYFSMNMYQGNLLCPGL